MGSSTARTAALSALAASLLLGVLLLSTATTANCGHHHGHEGDEQQHHHHGGWGGWGFDWGSGGGEGMESRWGRGVAPGDKGGFDFKATKSGDGESFAFGWSSNSESGTAGGGTEIKNPAGGPKGKKN